MAVRTASLTLSFGIDASIRVVALVGAGGKTSCMFRLAAELAAEGRKVVTTTTTKIFPPLARESPAVLLLETDPLLESLPRQLAATRHVTVGKCVLRNGKLDGISESDLNAILACADVVLVEADGAAGHPVKAPESWEPVIPADTDLVIPVIGLDCVGKPADNAHVFRLERFLDVAGMLRGDPIMPEALARLLASPLGAMRSVPPRARVVPLLNKLDALDAQYAIDEIAELILSRMKSRTTRIVFACLREPVETRIYEVGPVAGTPGGAGSCS